MKHHTTPVPHPQPRDGAAACSREQGGDLDPTPFSGEWIGAGRERGDAAGVAPSEACVPHATPAKPRKGAGLRGGRGWGHRVGWDHGGIEREVDGRGGGGVGVGVGGQYLPGLFHNHKAWSDRGVQAIPQPQPRWAEVGDRMRERGWWWGGGGGWQQPPLSPPATAGPRGRCCRRRQRWPAPCCLR